MKKFISKVKKVTFAIILAIISFPNKILAIVSPSDIDLSKVQVDKLKYVPPNDVIIWRIAKIFIIPIALLIGLIIYFKKSKDSKKGKIVVTIGIIAITVILYFVIDKIIYELV